MRRRGRLSLMIPFAVTVVLERGAMTTLTVIMMRRKAQMES